MMVLVSGAHVVAPAAEPLPAVHGVQDVAPVPAYVLAGHALQEEPAAIEPAVHAAQEYVDVQPREPHSMQPKVEVMPLHVELPEQQRGYVPLEEHAARARAARSARMAR